MGSYPQVGGQGEMLKAQLCPESRLPPLTPPAWLCPLCFSLAAAMIHSTFVGEFPLKCSHRTCGNAAVDPWCLWGALRLCLSPGSVLFPLACPLSCPCWCQKGLWPHWGSFWSSCCHFPVSKELCFINHLSFATFPLLSLSGASQVLFLFLQAARNGAARGGTFPCLTKCPGLINHILSFPLQCQPWAQLGPCFLLFSSPTVSFPHCSSAPCSRA